MKLKEIVSLLANKINQPHVIETYLRKVYDVGYNEGVLSTKKWIPVEQELPIRGCGFFNDSDTVLLKLKLRTGNIKILTGHYDLSMKEWYIDAINYDGVVIEWMQI